jgi:hypothetical protein
MPIIAAYKIYDEIYTSALGLLFDDFCEILGSIIHGDISSQ